MAKIDSIVALEKDHTVAWKRMDEDRKKYFLDDYVWYSYNEDKRKFEKTEGATHITLNLPLVFATKCNAVLMSAKQIMEVRGTRDSKKLTPDQKAIIKNYLWWLFDAADRRLRKAGSWPLKPTWIEQVNIRGGICARMALRMEGNKFIPDITPWDLRFVAANFDTSGIALVSYMTTRTADSIKAEYKENENASSATLSKLSGDKITVRDSWDAAEEKNIIYADQKILLEQDNPYDRIPVVLHYCQSGTMFQDPEAFEHRGESIFSQDRDMYDYDNMIASLITTLAVRAYRKPFAFKSKDGLVMPRVTPWKTGQGTGVAEDEGFDEVPSEDMNLAAQIAQRWFMDLTEMGGPSSADAASVNFPQSALAIDKSVELRNQQHGPRLATLADGFSDLAEMAIEQHKTMKLEVELGDIEDLQTFKVADLEGDMEVKYEFSAVYPEQNISQLSLANAQQGFYPKSWILDNTLKTENADEIIDLKDIEQAETWEPAFAMFSLAERLINRDMPEKAQLIAKIAKSMMQARLGGQNLPEGPLQQEPTKNDNLVALMASKNTGTSTLPAKETQRKKAQILSVSTGGKK